MASTKTRQGMVFLKEGASAPAAAPTADQSPACLVGLRTGMTQKSGTVQGLCMSSGEDQISGKHKMYPAMEAIIKTGERKHPTSLNSPSDTPSPDCVCKDVKVTLDNNSMWNEFFKCRTEMLLTKQGSRMFPYCRFRISGLQLSRKYSLIMDVEPLDNNQYKWTGESWQVCRKAEHHVKSKPFVHPDSPATGQHWMQSPVSFYRLKLTNNISDQEGNIILHPMHRYLPQLHLVPADRAVEDLKVNGPNVLTFTFPQTEFMTVSTYQNPQFTQLKVNYNPFVKKLKEDRVNSYGLKLKGILGKELNSSEDKRNTERHPVKKSLKVLLANHKPRHSKASDLKLPAPKEPQEKSMTSDTQSAANVPRESPRSGSCPAPKLISELICEAHVSLQRCHMEQRGSNPSNSPRAAQSNTTSTTLTDRNKQSVVHKNNGSVTTPTRNSLTLETTRNIKDNEHLSNSFNYMADVRTDSSAAAPTGGQVSLNKSDQQCIVGDALDGVKQQKRPARLPLPALALFLKQHSTKSKKAKNKMDTALEASLPEDRGSPGSAAVAQQETRVKPVMENCGKDVLPYEKVLNVTEQEVETTLPPSSPSSPVPVIPLETVGPKLENPFISISEGLGSGQMVPYHKTLNSENTFGSPEVSTLTLSTCSTSASSDLSIHLSTSLSLPDSSKAPAESSTLPSGSRSMKIDSVLPDPQCSSIDFDPLSPASSPEPLPPLPASLALELDSATSAAASTASTDSFEDPQHSRNSSVFKWHTVLPLSGTYTNPSFPTLQLQEQSTPLMSPLLSCLPEPQTINTSTSTPPKDPIPSFQETEQSLPFPAELSPLALQLPLSPTFSSLDEDGLSPTTSLSELVHFFSTDDDIGVEFSNTDTLAVPSQPLPVSELPQPSVMVQPILASKPHKRKKSSRATKLARLDVGRDGNDYRNKQPKVEEVEEQLFISFTSKEALKLHTAESSEELLPDPQLTLDTEAAEEPENSNRAECVEETIEVNEDILLRDLKLMKHRQVIHPVLQEVGLKMTLLDPGLSIDLQYLGVCLPIPPPGVVTEPLTQTVPTSQGVFASFQSRTGKTTDVTQIKGWKEKFTPLEAEPTSAPKPEVYPSSDVPKKNLSAFCSDMLDEYLESEGKLIDERASSFSQPPVEAPAYQLPVSSASYVRTVDHVLKKPTAGSPASDIISGFIPPSKRSRLKATCRRAERKQKGPKQNKIKTGSTVPELTAAAQMHNAVQTPGGLSQTTEPQNEATFTKRRRLKPRTSSQIFGASMPLKVCEDMAPLESDSELGPDSALKQPSDRTVDTQKKESRATVTRAFARLKELEDGVVWEGCFQTSITEERATIALTSLFTQTGFVTENPTAPIRLKQRRARHCLNEFCRLGCICSSLSHCSRISHCGHPSCMFGCSCLKQKVVLLKNLDSSDSSPTSPHCKIKKKRRRMLKMAYVLKEADTVTHPAERVRTLWRKKAENSDSEPVHAPDVVPFLHPPVKSKYHNSCARVRGFMGKMQKHKEESKERKLTRRKAAGLKSLKHGEQIPKQTKANVEIPRPHSAANESQAPNFNPPSPSEVLHPYPSKRLLILADCKWGNDNERSYVLKKLCEAMALEQLGKPFWIKKYLITPIEETVDESGANKCIQYKVQISTPNLEREKGALVKPVTQRSKQGNKPAAQHRQDNHSELIPKKRKPRKDGKKVIHQFSTDAVENWQEELMEEVEPVEDWQKEVEPAEDWQKEVEPAEDWQKEVEPAEDWQKEVEPAEDWQKEVEPAKDWQKEVEPAEDWQKEVEPAEDWQKEVEPAEDWQKEVEPAEDWQKEVEPAEDWQKEVEPAEDWQKEVEPAEDWQKEVEPAKDWQKEVEPAEDWQKEVEPAEDRQKEAEPMEDCQKEVKEDDIQKDGEECKSYQARHELERITDELNSVNRRRAGLALPFLTGPPPAGFLSANKKQLGGSDHVIQVNGKQYPFAKIELGRMGALHPANRLAAYLTGRAGSQRQKQASSTSELSCKHQSSPHFTSSAFCVPPAPPAPTVTTARLQTQQSVSKPILPSPPEDSETKSLVVGSSNPSLNLTPTVDPHPLLVQVPSPRKAVNLPPPRIPNTQFMGQRMVLKPVQSSSSGIQYYLKPDGSLVQLIPTFQMRPVNPSSTFQGDSEPKNLVVGSSNPSLSLTSTRKVVNLLPPVIPSTQFTGQRMVLKPVRSSSSGTQYYLKPDGSLVQLIPTNQLRPVNPSSTIQGVIPASCSQVAPVAAVKRPSLPNLCSSTSSAVYSSLLLASSSPGSSSSSSSSDSVLQPSASVSQQRTCTLKIIPPHPVKDPIIIKLPHLPPTQVVSSEGSLIGPQGPSHPVVPVNDTTLKPPVCQKADLEVKSVAVTEGVAAEHRSISPQTQPTIQTPTEPAIPRMPPTPAQSPPPKPTSDLPHPEQEMNLDVVCVEAIEVVDLVSSSETEDSSDFRESDIEDEKQLIADKQAVKRIQHQISSEDLKRKGKSLKKSRKEYLSIHGLSAANRAAAARMDVKDRFYISSEEDGPNRTTVTNGAAAAGELSGECQLRTCQQAVEEEKAWHRTLEKLEKNSGYGTAQQKMEMMSSSDMDTEVEALSPAIESPNSPRTRLQDQRHIHSMNERKLRAQIQQMLRELQKEVVPTTTNNKMSKISILKKAVELIQELRSSEEDLKRKKRSLKRSRAVYLSILGQSAANRAAAARMDVKDRFYISSEEDGPNRTTVTNGAAAAGELSGECQLRTCQQAVEEEKAWHRTLEKLEKNSGYGTAQQKMEMMSSSDMDTEVEALSPAIDSPNSPRTRLQDQAPREVQKLPAETERLLFIQSSKKKDNRDTHIQDVCGTSGTEKLQQLLTNQTNQKQTEIETRQRMAAEVLVEGAYCVAPPAGVADPLQSPQAPPCQGLGNASGTIKRTKTVPNILSRSRNQTLPLKTSAEKVPNLDKGLFAIQPGSTSHQTQELQPPPAAGLSPVLLLSAKCNQVRGHHQGLGQPLSPAASQSSVSGMYPHLDVQQTETVGQSPRQDPDNESLSSLLNEIVFLNQQTVAADTTAGTSAVKDCLQGSSVGGSEEQRLASEHLGPTSGNTTEGVLTPPPLLHMKVGGAKVPGLSTNDGAAVGGGGSGRLAWRPMPRLVPLGLRGNSPS
ncbi:MAX dimerization protein MGA a isoform X4 [Girardinichthys multiradiatus]|uniref:MAX dimerization protein MGA a isoform X4 n=1 Tax=Girardinichthys multiradiatus TaxID=208333 RepID=UPI001FABFB19|nr:MAX dimerization protein MGA a isoform X4 [Girardinichthys multiradiatus]